MPLTPCWLKGNLKDCYARHFFLFHFQLPSTIFYPLQIFLKTEKTVIFITNLQSPYYRQKKRAIASLLDGAIILPLGTGIHGSFSLLLTLEQL